MAAVPLQWAASWALAGLFAAAALHKLRNHLAFRSILEQYRIMPRTLVPVAAPLVILLEGAACLALLVPVWRPGGGLLAASLLALYSAAIAYNLYLRGAKALDCGCGGEATPLSGWLLLRNMALLALTPAAATPNPATNGWVLGLAVVMAAFLWLAYGATNQMLANNGKFEPLHG